jgi:uncharacterized membrane protein
VATVECSVEVAVSPSRAYEQWKRFEEYPRFLKGVEEVRAPGDGTLHWRARFLGRRQEWDAQITADEPGRELAWTTQEGPSNVTVSIAKRDGDRSLVTVLDDIHERGLLPRLAVKSGFARRRICKELASFKVLVERAHAPRGGGPRPAAC